MKKKFLKWVKKIYKTYTYIIWTVICTILYVTLDIVVNKYLPDKSKMDDIFGMNRYQRITIFAGIVTLVWTNIRYRHSVKQLEESNKQHQKSLEENNKHHQKSLEENNKHHQKSLFESRINDVLGNIYKSLANKTDLQTLIRYITLFDAYIKNETNNFEPNYIIEKRKLLNFSGLELSEINLTGIDLSHANLREANLEKAILWGAELQEANFQGADLQNADLQGANLQKAILWGTILQKAILQDANLQDANLQDANLQDAKLQYAKLQYANLQEAKLLGADLLGADLQEAKLLGADLHGANLLGADLHGAKLLYANLQEAKLQFAKFRRDNLGGIFLRNAKICVFYRNYSSEREYYTGDELREFKSRGMVIFDENEKEITDIAEYIKDKKL